MLIWTSKGGKYRVECSHDVNGMWSYRTYTNGTGSGGGGCFNALSRTLAIQHMQECVVPYAQADNNKTPMMFSESED